MKTIHTRLGASVLILAGLAATPAAAQDVDVSWTLGVDAVSQYVFRGVSLADDAIQPYVEASVGNFTVGAWASSGFGANSELYGDEIDLYVGYSVPLEGSLSLNLGGTYYHYPQGGGLFETEGGSAGSYEVSAALGFGEVALAPSLAAYYDFTLEAFTLEGALGHSVGFGEKNSFDMGLTVGHVEADGGGDYQWGHASVGISRPINEIASVALSANYVLNSEDNTLDVDTFVAPGGIEFAAATDDDLFWFGLGISAGF
ncbi:MAG: TorF family putative porin [Litorimonas sp.]